MVGMNGEKNLGAILILIVLILFVGYLYFKVNTSVSPALTSYYVPSSSLTASPYYSVPTYSVPTIAAPASSRSYSYYSVPGSSSSSSTSSSYYTAPSYSYTTTYPVTNPNPAQNPNQNCYVTGYDQYGNPLTTCQYTQSY